MEYALEGYGYSWSRLQRGLPAHRVLSAAARARLDAEIDDLAQARHATGIGADCVEAPADLLDALHVRAPSSPRAARALQVATAVRAAFDGLSAAFPVQVTHCAFDDVAEGASLVIGAWLPAGLTEVAKGDTVAPGLLITLRDAPDGDGGAHLDVLARVFRKICDNGAMIHEADAHALRVEPRTAGLGEAVSRRIAAALDPALFARCVEAFQASAADPLDYRGGPLGALLRHAIPYDTWRAVMGRFEGDGWTRWGLANAVTAEARWAKPPEEAARMERIGGWLARSPWHAYAELPPGLYDPAGSAAPIEESAGKVPVD
jgi:hypothetical protein